MKYRQWILFRLENGIVYWLWNGVYPILVTSNEDLDENNNYDWISFNQGIAPIAWKSLFNNLEKSRKRSFTFNGRRYSIIIKGEFKEP